MQNPHIAFLLLILFSSYALTALALHTRCLGVPYNANIRKSSKTCGCLRYELIRKEVYQETNKLPKSGQAFQIATGSHHKIDCLPPRGKISAEGGCFAIPFSLSLMISYYHGKPRENCSRTKKFFLFAGDSRYPPQIERFHPTRRTPYARSNKPPARASFRMPPHNVVGRIQPMSLYRGMMHAFDTLLAAAEEKAASAC